MTAFTFPNTATLTVSVAGKTGTVAITRDSNGRIRFSDGIKTMDFHSGDLGLKTLFEVMSALPDEE